MNGLCFRMQVRVHVWCLSLSLSPCQPSHIPSGSNILSIKLSVSSCRQILRINIYLFIYINHIYFSLITIKIDFSVSIQISLANHFSDFIFRQFLAQIAHYNAQFYGVDEAIVVLIKNLPFACNAVSRDEFKYFLLTWNASLSSFSFSDSFTLRLIIFTNSSSSMLPFPFNYLLH